MKLQTLFRLLAWRGILDEFRVGQWKCLPKVGNWQAGHGSERWAEAKNGCGRGVRHTRRFAKTFAQTLSHWRTGSCKKSVQGVQSKPAKPSTPRSVTSSEPCLPSS